MGLFLLAGCAPEVERPAAKPTADVEKTAGSSERSAAVTDSTTAGKSRGLRAWFFNISSESNPCEGWSWGQSDAKGTLGSFEMFLWHGRTDDGVPYWTVAGGDGYHNACIARNTTNHVRYGVKPGELAFHPGPDRHLAVVRWTAPMSGTASIWGRFGEGDSGTVDVYVLKTDGDGKVTEILFKSLNTAKDEDFKTTAKVFRGETIDFVVGNAGDWTGDSTPLQATIVLEPGPNPADLPVVAAPAEDDAAMALKAKEAMLDLIRSDRRLFIGDPDPVILARLELKKRDEHQYSLGAFVIDVVAKTYSADIGQDAPEVYFYSGKFEVDAAGRWKAMKPQVQRGRRAMPAAA